MTDERMKTLAHNLVTYSCDVQPGEKVLIETFDGEDTVAEELVKEVYKAGGVPFVNLIRPKVQRELLMNATKEQIQLMTDWDCERMRNMDAYIAFRGNDNSAELADVPEEKMNLYQSIYSKEVHSNLRVQKTKWVVLRYPNSSMAQQAVMSTRAFEDFYFKVCNLDYQKMSVAMDSLLDYFAKTEKVQLKGPGTDITFSIKGIGAKKCDGKMNVPDGEVYTAPVLHSASGTISFNTPSFYQGFKFENVVLTLENGKVVKATSNNTKRLNDILDTDEGARYIGEFSLGVNPYITQPMGDILFDEKIAGSIHFTPGSAYDDADNGNRSAVHWDLVLIQTQKWGGGEIYFDDKLIRKDGIFVVDELKCLNPENLA